MWANTFTSFVLDDQVQETYIKIIDPLKTEIKKRLIVVESNVVIDKLLLIDTLERLGISYHFEQEIENQLLHISKLCSEDYDLFTTALRFRLLRQHHHHISTDIFNKFKGKDNEMFDEKLISDAKGLLSLYEAAQLRTHDEDILEEAMEFTTQHLNVIVKKLESPFREHMNRALKQQLQRSVARIEARHYIAFYEQDNTNDEQLLKLAKVDFNFVQNLHKKELHDLSRWNIEEIDQLPDYMKYVYQFALSVYEELEHEVCKQGRSFTAPYIKEVIKEVGRGYNEELKWLLGRQFLTWEDQHSIFVITSNIHQLVIPALLGLKSASNHIFEWLIGEPKLIIAGAEIARFCNDLASHEREGRQGQMITTISNYMQQYGITMQEALSKFMAMIEDAWKDINTEWQQLPSYIPHDAAILVLNYARASDVIYKHSQDGYSYPEKILAPQIIALFVDPVIM